MSALTTTDPDADVTPETTPTTTPSLPDDVRALVLGWWSIDKPMAAIQVYQTATGTDLTTALVDPDAD